MSPTEPTTIFTVEDGSAAVRRVICKPRISTQEAARLLHVHRNTVLQMLQEGKLVGVQPGGEHSPWQVLLESVLTRLEPPV